MKKTVLTDGSSAPQQCRALPVGMNTARDARYPAIDLTKFILSFFICMVHIVPLDLKGEIWDGLNFWLQNYLCRIAVPYYFAAAGFLLFRKMTPDQLDPDRIKNYCLKLLRLLGTWWMLLFAGSPVHLWFFSAVIIAVLLVSLLLRTSMRLNVIGVIVLLLYFIGLLGDSYHSLLTPLQQNPFIGKVLEYYLILFSTTRNGVFFGAVYVFMGAVIAFRRKALPKHVSVAGLILSMCALAVEVFLLRSYAQPLDYNMLICLLPATFFLMQLTICSRIESRPIYKKLRIIGLLIFFLHLFVKFFVGHFIVVAKESIGIDLAPVRLLITVVVTGLAAVIIERLSGRKGFRWLRYLFS